MNKQLHQSKTANCKVKIKVRIGTRMIRNTKALTTWFNVLLIVTLFNSIGSPIHLALASTPTNSSTSMYRDFYPVNYLESFSGQTTFSNSNRPDNMVINGNNDWIYPSSSRAYPLAFNSGQDQSSSLLRLNVLSMGNVEQANFTPPASSATVPQTRPYHQGISGSSVIIVQSTFDTGTEGWSVRDATGPTHYPEGYIRAGDTSGPTMYWIAPATFTGDKSAAYGYKLYFDRRRNSSSDWDGGDDITLTGGPSGGKITLYINTSVPGTSWTTQNVLLHESAGWQKQGGGNVTKEDLLKVLSTLDELKILAEFRNGDETTDLDNVILYGSSLHVDQTLSKNECPFCGNGDKNNYIGGPINTRTGNYGYETTDLSIPTLSQPLSFERSYNSLTTLTDTVVYSRPIGYGWTHNYDINLTFPATDTAILKAPHGSRMRFFDEDGDGTYEPYPGVWANMTRQGTTSPYTYAITAANQIVYTFVDDLSPPTKLTAGNSAANDYFGRSVAISDDTAVVGAYGNDNNGSAAGSAYVFVRDGSNWSQQAILTATDGITNDYFGRSVAISGNTAIVGAYGDDNNGSTAGSAYVFVRDGNAWSQQAVLTATDGITGDYFGISVAISGDTAIVGAYGDDDDGSLSGAAYIFERSGNSWSQQAKVKADDGAASALFGLSVAISEDMAIVGAREANTENGSGAGAAYVYNRDGSNWPQQTKLTAYDGSIFGFFGDSVAIDQNKAVVGAPNMGNGSAYVFEYNGSIWKAQTKLTATDGPTYDEFGRSVALDGNLVVIGNDRDDDQGSDAGATYIFDVEIQKAHLHSIRDPQGNLTTFEYDANLYLTRAKDPTGQRYLDFSHDSQGRLIRVADHTGRDVEFGYNALDNLTVMTDTRDLVWTYIYTSPPPYTEDPHLLHKIINPEGEIVEQTFFDDAQGRATRQLDGVGRTMAEITYSTDGGKEIRAVTEAGRVYTDTYNTAGLLISQTDALGRSQDYSVDNNFNRTGTTDIRNQPTVYDRDSLGLTHAITNALNQSTGFEFDGQNNLSAAIEDDGTRTDYVYDSQNNLRQIVTLSGTIYYDYNSAGQVISTTNRRGYSTQYGYNNLGNLTVITNANLQTTHFTYDPVGRVETVTNARTKVTRYQYDNADHIRFVTENYQTGPCPANECNLTTEFQYDDAGRLEWVIDPANRRTNRQYDSGGKLERVIANYQDGSFSNSAPDEDIITRYGYDTHGRLQSTFETLAEGQERETRLIYDGLSRIEQVIFNYVNGGSDPDQNLTTSYAYQDDTVPAIVTVTGPTGVATRYEYDALGRLETRIDNYQTGPCPATECNLTTGYEYDNVGNLTFVTNPQSIKTKYEYSPLHRLAAVIENHTGSGVYSGIPDENITTRYGYDNEGNLLQLAINNEQLASYTYDALNRPDTMANALNHTWDYDYDPVGNLSQIEDPKLQIQTLQYDLLNRLTTIDYPAPDVDVTFGYDNLSRRIAMTDTTGTTGYGYDDLDRLTGVTDGNNQPVGYGYDAVGNRTSLTYPDSKSITYGYDDAGRLETLTPSWDSGSYTYDYLNHRLDSLTRPNGLQTDYGYDSANRLITLTHRTGSQTLGRYSYGLDKVSNISVATETLLTLLGNGYPANNGQVVLEAENGSRINGSTHNWLLKTSLPGYTGTSYLETSLDNDTLIQLNQITDSPKADYPIGFTAPGDYMVWLRGYPANAAGDSAYAGVDGQIVEVTGFDPQSWSWGSSATPLTITAGGVYSLSLWMREDGLRIDRVLLTTDTTFVPAGYGPTVTTLAPISTTITRTIVYTYDNLYRLTDADYSSGEFFDYAYDARGNRLSQTTLAGTNVYTYDAANRLIEVDGQVYTWDDNGNLTNDGLRSYGYDTANRLTSLTEGAVTTQFEYNGDGDRYSQSVGGVTTDYVLDPVGLAQVLVETTSGQSNFYVPGLAQYGNEWQYFATDRLGNTRQLADPVGEVLRSQTFDPFGNVLEQAGTAQSAFGYTGEQTDPTELVFLRARYYDPRVGRFLTADSIIPDPTNSQAWNRYAYVDNNPIRYADPSGHCPPSVCQGANMDPYYRSENVADWQRKADKGVTYEMYLTGQGQYNQYAADGNLYLQDKMIATGIQEGDAEAARARLRFAEMYDQLYATNMNLDSFLPAEAFESTVDQACSTGDTGKIISAYMIFMTIIGLSDHDDLGGKSGRNIPNPYGRRGSPAHQSRILEAEQRLTEKGWTVISGGSLPERAVRVSGGRTRYPDLVMQRGSKTIAIQVGKATKKGLPIARERRALQDLRSTGEFNHVFFLRY